MTKNFDKNGKYEIGGKTYIELKNPAYDGDEMCCLAFCPTDKVEEDGYQPLYTLKFDIKKELENKNEILNDNEIEDIYDWENPEIENKGVTYSVDEDRIY